MDCLFCKIASGEIESKLIYKDEQIVAFHDINPQAPVHCLIIPKQHIETINDVKKANVPLLGHMIYTAKNIANELGLSDDGYRLVFNTNRFAGQEVFHIHLHCLGGRQMVWPPG